MKTYYRAFALLAIGATAGRAAAWPNVRDVSRDVSEEDSLLPETGILFEPGGAYQYQEALLRAFFAGRPTIRECQMVVESGFAGREFETAVFIERDRGGDKPVAVSLATTTNIHLATSEVKQADIVEERIALSNETADLLSQLCEMMMSTARYPARLHQLLHPYEAHFAHHDVDHGFRAGKTVTSRGRVGRFVAVLDSLREYAQAPRTQAAIVQKKMEESARALIGELNKDGIAVPDIAAKRSNRSVRLPAPKLPETTR
jgi:hypothetical protein